MMKKSKPIIIFDQVTKSFDLYPEKRIRDSFSKSKLFSEKELVLKDIDFSIDHCEVVGLYGANGSGKTTILRLIAGIFKPDSGQVIVNAKVAAVLELGAGLHPDLTGRENIELYGAILGLAFRERLKTILKIISFSGLEDKIDLPIRKYSSGMKSRLAFSIVAFFNADILLLDEVFAVGDKEFLDKSKELMTKLKNKKTIVIASHNIGLLHSFCDRVIRFENGCIRKENKLINFFLDLPKGTEFMSEVFSDSMAPLLQRGDYIVVKKIPFSQIKIGDVVAMYLKKLDESVVHRIVGKKNSQEYMTRGDNNYFYDNWVLNKNNYLGLVNKK